MKIENLNQFRSEMWFTTVTESGKVTVSLGPKKYTGWICQDADGYYVDMDGYCNSELFKLAGVDKSEFTKAVLGYTDNGAGYWPWMRSTDDVLKVLAALDRRYQFQAPDIEKPKSTEMEMEHPSIEDIDFAPKKKHYSLNFRI